MPKLAMANNFHYKGSLTSTVSTPSTNFSAIGIKFVQVEFVISKFILIEFSLRIIQLVQILHSTIKSQKSY